MKVKDILKKVNPACTGGKVILKDINSDAEREVVSFDFSDYYYTEKEYTVKQIRINNNTMYIYYSVK